MNGWEAVAVVAAGIGAGGVNAIVGSGSLITFPTLLALGYPSVVANVSNTVGLVPGSLSALVGFRRELVGQRRRIIRLATGSASGALVGGLLLLTLPSSVFDAVVPLLVIGAAVLMAFQPRLSAWVTARRAIAGVGPAGPRHADGEPDDEAGVHDVPPDVHDGVGTLPIVLAFLAGIYGGYFGAAQGIILLTMLAILVPDDLRRSNALKNVLAGMVNGVAALFFILFADVAWEAAGLIAVGAAIGGFLGARVGRRIDPRVLRAIVVIGGIAIGIRLIVT